MGEVSVSKILFGVVWVQWAMGFMRRLGPGANSAATDSLKRPLPDGDNFVCEWLVLSSQLSIISHGLQHINGVNCNANRTLLDIQIEGQSFLALLHSLFLSGHAG